MSFKLRFPILLFLALILASCSKDNNTPFTPDPDPGPGPVTPPIDKPVNPWDNVQLSPLHTDGRWLCDANGNHVNLHGFGQTYSPYFNSYAWCKNSDGSVNWGQTYNARACVEWNQLQISTMLKNGWKVNWLRLHMDPHWSNKPGVHTTGENDISAFDETLFVKYLDEIFVPMAKFANEHGLYVVMRPPGVCPEKIAVGDAYQSYLKKVWSIVCQHSYLKNNPFIMFELANEPINILGDDGQYNSWGNTQQKNCTRFFQDIVDMIRAYGSNNILWVPGLSYQMNYQGYVKYPINGENIGFAVHCYPGWYGSDSEADGGSVEQGVVTKGNTYADFQAGWNNNIGGASQLRPILVTEMDWAPKSYNSSWGKATTGELGGVGFGANFKYIMDKTGNVSWMLFTDADKLALYDDNAPDGHTFLTDPQACVRPCYRWFKEYANPNWKFVETLADENWYFPGSTAIFSPNIWEKGTCIKNSDGSHTVTTGQYGFAGWKFPGGFDMSTYKYLVVNLVSAPTAGSWSLRLFDVDNYWVDCNQNAVGSKTQVVVNLQSMKTTAEKETERTLDPSHIYILGFWSTGSGQLKIKDIYLTNNSDYTK